jgi:hypothetical protein
MFMLLVLYVTVMLHDGLLAQAVSEWWSWPNFVRSVGYINFHEQTIQHGIWTLEPCGTKEQEWKRHPEPPWGWVLVRIVLALPEELKCLWMACFILHNLCSMTILFSWQSIVCKLCSWTVLKFPVQSSGSQVHFILTDHVRFLLASF